MTVLCKASGGGAPGGLNTHVQFNDSDEFGGDPNLTWEKLTNRLSVLGADIIVNGDFVTDTDWTKTGDAYIDTVNQWADFNVVFYVGQTGTWSPSTPLSITIGETYLITFDLTDVNIDFSFTVGGYSSPTIVAGGSYAFLFTASATTNLTFTATCTATKKTAFNFDNVMLKSLGAMEGYFDVYGMMLRANVGLLGDYVISIGDTSAGIKQIHLGALPASALPEFSGLVYRQSAGGDFYIGNDNVFPGYYVQKTVVHDSIAVDNSQDYTNLYQGDSGYQAIALNYAIEYTGSNGIVIGGATTHPPDMKWGGLVGGFIFDFDKPNDKFVIDGNGSNTPILEIGLNHTTTQEVVRPKTDNKIDLGDTANSLIWKNIYAYIIDAATNFAVGGANGHTGWFDDGVNFRVTVTGGIITGIAASSGGGFA